MFNVAWGIILVIITFLLAPIMMGLGHMSFDVIVNNGTIIVIGILFALGIFFYQAYTDNKERTDPEFAEKRATIRAKQAEANLDTSIFFERHKKKFLILFLVVATPLFVFSLMILYALMFR